MPSLAASVLGAASLIAIPAAAPRPESCPPPTVTPATTVTPSTSATPSSPQPSPSQIVACVGSQSITRALFLHWLGVAKKAEEPVATERARGRVPKSRAHLHALLGEVLGFLISSDWVIGEAQNLNVQLSDLEVRRKFDHIRHQQFHKRGEFSAFLRSSGQTTADLLFRVRVNLLTMRIQERIVAGHNGASAEEALTRFVREFKSRWRAQTSCSPAYAVSDCGHVQTLL
jgi:hypothetical protein